MGHIANANPLHSLFPDGTDVIAIFTAEDSYISPNWYPSKAETHRQVPTWNYQVVHMKGRMRFDHSNRAKLAAVGALTKRFETQYSGENEWKITDAPKDYIAQMLENIVACEIEVKTILAKSKLSQNKTATDFDSVKNMMKKHNKHKLFEAMDTILKPE